LEIIEY